MNTIKTSMTDPYSLKNRWQLNISGQPNRLFTPPATNCFADLVQLAHQETGNACVKLLYQRQGGSALRLQTDVLRHMSNVCLIESDKDLSLLRQSAYTPVIYAVTESVWRQSTMGGESVCDVFHRGVPLGSPFYSDQKLRALEEDLAIYVEFSETESSQEQRYKARELRDKTMGEIEAYYEQLVAYYLSVIREETQIVRSFRTMQNEIKRMESDAVRLEKVVERFPSMQKELDILRQKITQMRMDDQLLGDEHRQKLRQTEETLRLIEQDREQFRKRKFY
jgi:hypothetical protein